MVEQIRFDIGVLSCIGIIQAEGSPSIGIVKTLSQVLVLGRNFWYLSTLCVHFFSETQSYSWLQEQYRKELFELLQKGQLDEVDPIVTEDLAADGSSKGGFFQNLSDKFTGGK